jgi:hypothetical protein
METPSTAFRVTLSTRDPVTKDELLALLRSPDPSFSINQDSVSVATRRGLSSTEFLVSLALSVSSGVTVSVLSDLLKQKLLRKSKPAQIIKIEIVDSRASNEDK